MRAWLREHKLLWMATGFWLLGAVCDDMSSMHFPPGWYESNPFARDIYGAFILGHAIAYDLSIFALYLLLGWIMYLGIRKWSELIAQVAFAAFFIYDAAKSYEAAIHNTWIRLGWYVVDGMLR